MEIINYFINIIKIAVQNINTIELFVILFGIIIIYQILIYLFKDKKYIKNAKSFKDPEVIRLEDLKYIPLVNIIIPAWNKGKTFENCLSSILYLNYPRLKVIVNAGGSDETIKIAKSFEKYNNFIILRQEKGPYIIQGQNKIRALNQCFDYVSEGILFLIDADCYLTNEILLRMIHPIINYNEKVVCADIRPLISQESKDLIKYIYISRSVIFNNKFSRHNLGGITGANACLNYDVIKKIGKFSENKIIIEEVSRGKDLANHGFYSYSLIDYRSRIYTEYPKNLKELYWQRRRYILYNFLYSIQMKKIKSVLSIFLVFGFSIYILILPILFFFNLNLFLIGFIIYINLYIKKCRKCLDIKKSNPKDFSPKFNYSFFLKLFFYIYMEILFNIRIMFGLIPFILKYKKQKASLIF